MTAHFPGLPSYNPHWEPFSRSLLCLELSRTLRSGRAGLSGWAAATPMAPVPGRAPGSAWGDTGTRGRGLRTRGSPAQEAPRSRARGPARSTDARGVRSLPWARPGPWRSGRSPATAWWCARRLRRVHPGRAAGIPAKPRAREAQGHGGGPAAERPCLCEDGGAARAPLAPHPRPRRRKEPWKVPRGGGDAEDNGSRRVGRRARQGAVTHGRHAQGGVKTTDTARTDSRRRASVLWGGPAGVRAPPRQSTFGAHECHSPACQGRRPRVRDLRRGRM